MGAAQVAGSFQGRSVRQDLASRGMELLCAICDVFVLVGARNPCPCGYYGDSTRDCTCSMSAITRYRKRIPGPLLQG